MSRRLCSLAVLAILVGCGGSGGDEGPPPIRISSFDAIQGDPNEGTPGDVANDGGDGAGTDAPDASGGEPAVEAPDDGVPDEAAPGDGSAEPVPPVLAADGTPLPKAVGVRLRDVFRVVNGEAIEFAAAVSRRLIDVEVGPREGFQLSRSGVDEATGVENVTLLCPGGGTLDTFSSRPLSSDGTYVLRSCVVGPLVLDGQIEGRVRGPDRETDGKVVLEPSYEFIAFSIVDSRDDRIVSIDKARIRPFEANANAAGGDVGERFGYGRIEAFDPNASVGPGSVFETYAGRAVTVIGGLATTAREKATAEFPLGGLTTRFDVIFEDVPGRNEVRTLEPFARLDAEGRFASGSLSVTGEGGSFVYTIDADDGDPATFRLDVSADGVMTSYAVPWSDTLGFDAFETETVDVGF